ncbi:acetyltransferase [Spirochaetia bacterium]|nr:acetyltransferase [Spirochaetia bacterium]
MILNTINISNEQILEINNLVNLCEKYDNTKTCIQMDHFLNHFKDLKSWILYYNKEELIGIVSIFAPMINEAEISICINPKYRKKGIAKELMETAHKNLEEFNIGTILYVCDRNSKNGMEIIKNKGFTIHHTEYTMKYIKQPQENNNQRIIIKMANESDMEIMINILLDAFGGNYEETKGFIASSIKSESRKGYIGIKDNKNIGIAFVGYDKDISINTVGIIKEEQNKGYGKELIKSIINQLDYNNRDIIIDVDSNNINAYKLYKNVGFKEIMTIDYYQGQI